MEESMRWVDGIDFSIVVCDRRGICLFANERARATFGKLGVAVEIGKNLVECHEADGRTAFVDYLANPKLHTYTVDKGGQRLLIRREPFYAAGEYVGIVQLGFVIPAKLPHVVRTP
jgi:hypothetical protein